MPTERPILFSGPQVRALLDGSKTETRRVGSAAVGRPRPDTYAVAGDLLWVRETWGYEAPECTIGAGDGYFSPPADVYYRADDPDADVERWRPNIHMPKRLARIWVRVVEVRVERVQEITEAGATAEGCEGKRCDHRYGYGQCADCMSGGECTDCVGSGWLEPPKANFMGLWDEINGAKPGRSWADNPWVWVVRFELVSTTGRPDADPS